MRSDNSILPAEVASESVEMHFQDYRSGYKGLYLMLLGLFVIGFILMFIIRVDISVVSAGIIKPVQERAEIRSAVSGIVRHVNVRENERVQSGQLLAQVENTSISEQNTTLDVQLKELLLQKQDLESLLQGKSAGLQSKLYRQQYIYYRQKRDEVNIRVDAARRSFNRYKKLYQEKVISPAEYERYEYEYKTILNQSELLREEEYSKWQTELTALDLRLEEMGAKKTAFSEQKDQFEIRAPSTGYVQQLRGVSKGSFLNAGEIIGEISPDSGLIAEVYVRPNDIGYISVGLPVKLQVDAYDYNVWGMADAKVISVSRDIFIDNGKPLFKIRCSLHRSFLEIKNGYQGEIKKGMTLNARFKIARRSLFQLLYDKVDDWLNPNLSKHDA